MTDIASRYRGSKNPVLFNRNNPKSHPIQPPNHLHIYNHSPLQMEAPKFAPERSFQEEFRHLTRHIEFFKTCYEESKDIISQIESVFKKDMNPTNPEVVFISNEERAQLDEFITKRASVLVVGQTNSGKSSLINELLGSSYLPTSEVPCTSRIVRIRYSEKNYIKVKDSLGETEIQETHFKKNIPKAEIVLEDDSKRGDKIWTSSVVEVGLNNPLLQGGNLEFVDAPGMSENEVLDSIVKECVHGILQILIYVIDGNSSLRTQDREFLLDLKQKIGAIPIFFVCNKVDFNHRAAEFDRDDDEDESYLEYENQMRIINEKKMRSFSALVRSHIIETELNDVDSCDYFHGVSTREVRKARRARGAEVDIVHTNAFERMKRCFLRFASESIVTNVNKVASLLGTIQQRIFDFYISRQYVDLEMHEIYTIIETLRNHETACFEKMRIYVLDNHRKIESILTTAINDNKYKILDEAENMEFAPIPISDVVHRNEIVNQYKGQIQKMVLMAALNASLAAAAKTVRFVSSNWRQQLQLSLNDASKNGGLTGKLVKQQMRQFDVLKFDCVSDVINMAVVKDYSLMNFMYKAFEPPKAFIADLVSVIKGTTVDKSWKRKVAKNILDNVDRSKLAERIIGALLDNLHTSHEAFQTNLNCIEVLSAKARSQTKEQAKTVGEYGPAFARVLCLNDALLESLENHSFRLGDQIGRTGNRSTVYQFHSYEGRFSEMKLAANQPHENAPYLVHYAIQHALKRLEETHPNVMSPVSLVLIDNRLTLLLPRLQTDLYTALESKSLSQHIHVLDRLTILKQMVDACLFCRKKGLQLFDPRITNVMLDEGNRAFLNICKPRDDSICYPDNLAPFHVFTAPPPLIHTSEKDQQIIIEQDTYALGIMGWLLVQGEYKRPAFAETCDVTEVYDAVHRRGPRELFPIPDEAEKMGFTELIYNCLGQNACSILKLQDTLSCKIESFAQPRLKETAV